MIGVDRSKAGQRNKLCPALLMQPRSPYHHSNEIFGGENNEFRRIQS